MALTFDNMVDRIVGQFDCTTSRAAASLNERHARMCADAKWRMAKKSLGTTTAGTSNYTLPAEVVDLAVIRIDHADGTVLYHSVGLEELWQIDSSDASLVVGDGGLFAADYTDTGGVEVRIYPTPDVSGLAITGLQVIQPSDSTYGGTDNIVIPGDLKPYILDGALADLYSESEEDLNKAAYHEARFQQGTELLRRRKNSRMDGSLQYLRVGRRPTRRG